MRGELQEELGAKLEDVSYLAMLENIFVYEGEPAHEVALIYGAALSDRPLYEQDASSADAHTARMGALLRLGVRDDRPPPNEPGASSRRSRRTRAAVPMDRP